jgi:hypothetical protein
MESKFFAPRRKGLSEYFTPRVRAFAGNLFGVLFLGVAAAYCYRANGSGEKVIRPEASVVECKIDGGLNRLITSYRHEVSFEVYDRNGRIVDSFSPGMENSAGRVDYLNRFDRECYRDDNTKYGCLVGDKLYIERGARLTVFQIGGSELARKVGEFNWGSVLLGKKLDSVKEFRKECVGSY